MSKSIANGQTLDAGSLTDQVVAVLQRADPRDLPALAALHTQMQRAAEAAGLDDDLLLQAALGRAANTVEAVVLGEVDDPREALAKLARLLSGTDAPGSGDAAQGDERDSDGAITGMLDEIAETLLLVEAADLPGLATLHTQFEQIAAWAEDNAEFEVKRTAEQAANTLEAVVLGEAPDDAAALAEVLDAVSAMQRVVRDGRDAIDVPGLRDPAPAVLAETELAAVRAAMLQSAPAAEPVPVSEPQLLEADDSLLADFVTEAREHLDAADVCLLTLETSPQDEEALNAVFRGFHTIKGVAGFLSLRDILHLAHEAESLLDKARTGAVSVAGPVIDVVFEAIDLLKVLVEAVNTARHGDRTLPAVAEIATLVPRIRMAAGGGGSIGSRLGDILVAAGVCTADQISLALSTQEVTSGKLGEVLVREGQVGARDVASALRTQRAMGAGGPTAAPASEAVRVDQDRLDRLIDTIGELVIAESMVTQSPQVVALNDAIVARQIGQLDKITRELQELGTSLRMVPVRATFQKMARLVRDLGVKTGKQVEFVSNGDETELDRSVVERIGDPLVHMVRNAVDHGIETDPAARAAAGKPAVAKVELRAYHKGGNIHIEIADDGRGLDRDAIWAKAIERGLVRDGDVLSDSEIYAMIFQAGFSTAKEITDVSGRGVGMDVVRQNIEALRGTVLISSEKGRGSVFTIRLPLTLAVIDGMVVRVGAERYILPTLSIVTSIRPTAAQYTSVLGQGEMLDVQNKLLPLFRLGELFGQDDAATEVTEALAIVVEDGGRHVCLLADELLGQQQIVIKNLGEALRGLPGIAGGAIMPDGRVGLILDVSGLVRLAQGSQLQLDAA